MTPEFKSKIEKIKKDLSELNTEKPFNEQFETNKFYYVKKIVDFMEANPTQTRYTQNLICKTILDDCCMDIALSVCELMADIDYNLFDIHYVHNSYDDSDHEVEHEMEKDEFIKAFYDPSYTPIELNTGHPVDFYMHKWIQFECYAYVNAKTIEGLDF